MRRSAAWANSCARVETASRRDSAFRSGGSSSNGGKYNRDVRTFLEDPARDPSVLRKWEGRTFVDAQGRVHTFETDPARILSAVERAESEYGSFDIYPEGDESEETFAEA